MRSSDAANMVAIEASARALRARARGHVAELARRATPAAVAANISDRLSTHVKQMAAGAADQLKSVHIAGSTGVMGLVATAAAFEIGRWSVGERAAKRPGRAKSTSAANVAEQVSQRAAPNSPIAVMSVARAVLLGAFGLILGGAASAIVPRGEAETRLAGAGRDWVQAKAREVLSLRLDSLLKFALNATGVSRYTAIGLVALSLLERLGAPELSSARRAAP